MLSKKIMITWSGSPAASAMVQDIKKFHSNIYLIGADSDKYSPNRWLFDKFLVPPESTDSNYVSLLQATGKSCNWIIPTNAQDALVMLKSKVIGPKVLSSSSEVISEVIDRSKLYERYGVQFKVGTSQSLYYKLSQMNVDKRDIVIKPVIARGNRGIIILTRVDDFVARNELNPDHLFMSYYTFINFFNNSKWSETGATDRKWIVMPRYKGEEYLVNCLCKDGEILWHQVLIVVRKLSSVPVLYKSVRNPVLSEHAKMICRDYKFNYWVTIKFIDDHIISVEPILHTFVGAYDYSIAYLPVLLAEGEGISEFKYPPPPPSATGQRYFSTFYSGL